MGSRSRGRRVRRWGVVALALLGAACGSGPRPNVMIVTVDTLRADHTSAYGYERPTTPHLEEVARNGVRFDVAYSPTSTTGPSHATLFTGQYPIHHRVVKNGLTLADAQETLVEILAEHGYQTAGFVSSFVLDARFGYAQGFETFDDDFRVGESSVGREEWEGHQVETFDRRAQATTDAALHWLERSRDAERPFFLFVHYFDPHAPYAPPGEHALRFVQPDEVRGDIAHSIRLYDAEIAYTDLQLGRLLDALERGGLARDTLLIVTADHGEGLMDHGYLLHGIQIYEESVRIPLLVRWPRGVEGGRSLTEPVGLVDLAPTLLELLGIDPPPGGFQGRSLARTLRDGAPLDPERPVYLHRRHYKAGRVSGLRVSGEKFGVRAGRWKYIDGPQEGTRELFDLSADPDEMDNAYYAQREVAERMAKRLAGWRARYERSDPVPELDDADRRGLEALGYVE